MKLRAVLAASPTDARGRSKSAMAQFSSCGSVSQTWLTNFNASLQAGLYQRCDEVSGAGNGDATATAATTDPHTNALRRVSGAGDKSAMLEGGGDSDSDSDVVCTGSSESNGGGGGGVKRAKTGVSTLARAAQQAAKDALWAFDEDVPAAAAAATAAASVGEKRQQSSTAQRKVKAKAAAAMMDNLRGRPLLKLCYPVGSTRAFVTSFCGARQCAHANLTNNTQAQTLNSECGSDAQRVSLDVGPLDEREEHAEDKGDEQSEGALARVGRICVGPRARNAAHQDVHKADF
jgi:hypothetical protein